MSKQNIVWGLTPVEEKMLIKARKLANKADIAANKFYDHFINRFYKKGYDGHDILDILLASDVYVIANSGDCSSDEDRVWNELKYHLGVK